MSAAHPVSCTTKHASAVCDPHASARMVTPKASPVLTLRLARLPLELAALQPSSGLHRSGREGRRVGHNDRREEPVRAARGIGEGAAARARDEADEDGAEHVVPAELGPREPAGGGDGALRRGSRGRLGVALLGGVGVDRLGLDRRALNRGAILAVSGEQLAEAAQAASTEFVADGVEPRGALPLPPTDSGETDSNEDSFSAPFSFPVFSSSPSSISALTFVSSRSYLLVSSGNSLVETFQSASPAGAAGSSSGNFLIDGSVSPQTAAGLRAVATLVAGTGSFLMAPVMALALSKSTGPALGASLPRPGPS